MEYWSRRKELMNITTFGYEKEMFRPFPSVGRLFQCSNPFRTLNYHGRRQPALLVIWTLLFIGYFPTSMQTDQVGQGESWSLERNDQECPTCTRERAVSVMKDDEIKRWRIESTKQQILDRLEMDDRPPKVKTKEAALHLHSLPPTIVLPDSMSSSYEVAQEVEPIRQIILFPSKTFRRNKDSRHHHNDPPPLIKELETITLKFPITDEMHEAALHSAVLWTAQQNSDNATNAESVEWESTDVTMAVDRQIGRHQRHKFLSLPFDTRLHLDHPQQPQPYLIIQVDPSQRRSAEVSSRNSRQKRNTTPRCGATVTQCCRESLFVSFKDVGWDDWIVAPSGFHAFYCRGSCRSFTAPASSATTHASLLQKLAARERVPSEARAHLAPCCAPTRLSTLTIWYSEENGVIKQRTLPNMIVESCGCAL
ncbi:inhibin beta B chain-like [Daphnia carinata]|uniref:inhibin beta B chain-like n=1 Tax=Daphnia carinata TaxID=120202 RepID=UPI002580C2F8|nr:inhibin beta B chain-like [Daphnia carinata]